MLYKGIKCCWALKNDSTVSSFPINSVASSIVHKIRPSLVTLADQHQHKKLQIPLKSVEMLTSKQRVLLNGMIIGLKSETSLQ